MIKYAIKYETYDGDVEVVEKYGYSKQHAESQLVNCKIIYWTERVLS